MTQIKLPPLSQNYELVTYKITRREQNAQAEVNAAFLYKFKPHTHDVEKARIVYGNINPTFTHAYKTEKFLVGRNLFTNETLQSALHILEKEIDPIERPPYTPPYVRRKVALGLFYKGIIKLCPKDIIKPFYKSGATTPSEDRPPVSRSYQEYDTDQKDYPITQPLLKKEGMIQCAGEAVYSDDIPTIKDEVFATFVLATVPKGDIESIDTSEVLKVKGVIAVLTSADIPGVNSVVRRDFLLMMENEEFLASDKVIFFNQPVAIVVADTQVLADKMAKLVKVKYKNIPKKPIIFTIEDAIKAPKEENRLVSYPGIVPMERGANVRRIIKGTFISPRQYHHMMELHTTVTKPVDEGLEVASSTQFIDITQASIAQLLKMTESLIIVQTRRCGGGFGCKISRSNFAALATALVAKKLNRACRMSMSMQDIMRVTGKRPNSRLDYEIGVDDRGEIQYMDSVFYVNDGNSSNENENTYATDSLKNCYNPRRWKVDSFGVITDAPSNTFMRAPGGLEGITGIEHIMDRIALELNIDPVEVRMANYRQEDNDLPVLVPRFLERINYRERQDRVKEFNDHNRWKKRGIKMNNMAFPTAYIGNYGALVSVYHGDGSVVISCGGTEIGQGIFTKVAQVAAAEFRVPVETVTVTPCYNFSTPNNFAVASSITSECCAYAVIRCCDQINARLAPFRAAMPTASWREIVFEADRQGVLLQANYLTSQNDPRLIDYSIFGIGVVEVEVDILSGSKWIVRADIFEDVGRSMNPAIDLGQVEGAFVQSLSLWTMEIHDFDEHTGEIYTDRTWTYKIIGAKDIPWDFRVFFRRNRPNPVGILGSKAAGEPPCCLAYSVVEAIREAVQASRKDSGKEVNYLNLKVPVNIESIVKGADVKIEEFLLY
ncbi:xanthine dehydrogenase-like [Anticarsia gemmatalis]|uniref:xanthine dehydrogenase-like n=1 Tax=Anticarsia gemmatalis TaxID=129554 RepID=UPI003F7665F5